MEKVRIRRNRVSGFYSFCRSDRRRFPDSPASLQYSYARFGAEETRSKEDQLCKLIVSDLSRPAHSQSAYLLDDVVQL